VHESYHSGTQIFKEIGQITSEKKNRSPRHFSGA